MNEFIVWDKKSKKFRVLSTIVYNTDSIWDIDKKDIGIKLVNLWGQPFNDDGEQNPNILVQREPKHFTIHEYIGKTDINDKKIYADCSIVEFDYYQEVSREGSYEYEAISLKGYFSFSEQSLSYRFIEITEKYSKLICNYDDVYMKNFKIIDTIQENKLGLIK